MSFAVSPFHYYWTVVGLLAGMYAGPGRAWAGVIACSGGVGVRRGRDF